MRVIKIKTLQQFWLHYPDAHEPLLHWYEETIAADWKTPHDLKNQFRNASIINTKRVVFNIKGNSYRLVVDIEYRLGLVFIVWIGNHHAYDTINVETITYHE
jgi:mRNA interferase HigB